MTQSGLSILESLRTANCHLLIVGTFDGNRPNGKHDISSGTKYSQYVAGIAWSTVDFVFVPAEMSSFPNGLLR